MSRQPHKPNAIQRTPGSGQRAVRFQVQIDSRQIRNPVARALAGVVGVLLAIGLVLLVMFSLIGIMIAAAIFFLLSTFVAAAFLIIHPASAQHGREADR